LGATAQGLDPADAAVAQALADAATISVLQYRALRDARALAENLREALTSRILIEQAKGVCGERWQTTMDEAFARLRRYARSTNQRLSDVARDVTTGRLAADELARLTE
jgi:AmiR/NasT family two-component response regulator